MLVSITGPHGPFYANDVGTSGVVASCRDWERLSIAVRRWSLALVGNNETLSILFPGGNLVPAK